MVSYCKKEGEDIAVFVTEEDYHKPGMMYTLTINEDEWGIILPNGEINWKCPCLEGIIQSPCGEEFKSAFGCFHHSTEEVKGSDCFDSFRSFQECVAKHPNLFGEDEYDYDDDDDDMDEDEKLVRSIASSVVNADTTGDLEMTDNVDTNFSQSSDSNQNS